jgi:hypothetical protein
MDAEEIKAMYRSFCLQPITVRRYSGTGAGRTPEDFTPIMGNARLYSGKELVDGVAQGDQQIILIADDLVAVGLTMPLRASDKILPGGRELTIVGMPGERNALDGSLVAYDLQARG